MKAFVVPVELAVVPDREKLLREAAVRRAIKGFLVVLTARQEEHRAAQRFREFPQEALLVETR